MKFFYLFCLIPFSIYGLTIGNTTILSTNIPRNQGPQVAVAQNGDALVVWISSEDVINVSNYTSSTDTWVTNAGLGTNLVYGAAVQIGMDQNGNAFVVYVTSQNSGVGPNNVAYIRYDASTATWSSETLISEGGSTINVRPQLSVAGNGVALVIWFRQAPQNFLYSEFDTSTNTFSTPAILTKLPPTRFQLDDQGRGVSGALTSPAGTVSVTQFTVP
jgi:hypothetical protein